jgi:hypothetical protein
MTFHESLTPELAEFIARQPVFFVATATADSRINLSPKGHDTFRVLGPARVAWLDVTGSGNETNAHLVADGRVTVMFCSFDRTARIMRLFGRARPVLPQDADWQDFAPYFDLLPGTRQIFVMDVDTVQTTCGYGVPVMTLDRERDTLSKWNLKLSDAEQDEYRLKNNAVSIDGLPARLPERRA